MLFENGYIKVRQLQPEDKHLLVKWLSNPSVLEFYEGRDNSFDLEKVNKKFYHRENGIVRCVIEYEGVSIGYIQIYQVNETTSSIDNYDEEETTFGMNQFIGETEYWNRGIGTLLVKSMLEYLIEKKQATRVIMDSQTTNLRAISCYEKCGFKKIRLLPNHEFHEGKYRDCWLIEYKKSSL
ncbi:GNAT family N-acetyltransferase [Neobacillus soli]|uniref:GNAT family N-acetyltransferase n=1 Tax=Neobacillus soli TaxID=220688 RepID=UPI0008245C72|nr:GNAT family N-acetyltransferase [Neobacillus soli]